MAGSRAPARRAARTKSAWRVDSSQPRITRARPAQPSGVRAPHALPAGRLTPPGDGNRYPNQESRNRIAAARPGRTLACGRLSSSQPRGNRRRTDHPATRSASQVYLRRTSGLWRRGDSLSWVRCLRMPVTRGMRRRVPSGSLTSTVDARSTYRSDRFNCSFPSATRAADPSWRTHREDRRPRTPQDLV